MQKPVTLVIGANSAIGSAVIRQLAGASARQEQDQAQAPAETKAAPIVAFSRSLPEGEFASSAISWRQCAYSDAEIGSEVQTLARQMKENNTHIYRVIICNGFLHSETLQPEKRIEDISQDSFLQSMAINALLPLRWLQALTPLLAKTDSCKIAVLSARVGSIGDNRLGGWYSYRASKAALNMLLQTASVELARRAPGVKLIAFHPGTTDTPLSKPFSKNVAAEKMFSPDFVAGRLLALMDTAITDGKLAYLDWDGKAIDF
ncbi:MAG: SDR family NAD(P)-dependent oxidoreductase [Pseudomonadales bacterium]